MKKPAAEILTVRDPFPLEFGGRLASTDVAYETWGRLAADRGNAVLICPAFSAHSHARSLGADPSPGWWESMIGPGRAFDTDRFFVICPSLLGSCYGTTGPVSTDPATGQAYASRFPVVSVRDMVNLHARLLDQLGIERLHAAAGGSLGGMETIELAVHHPDRAHRIVSVSSTDRTRPYTAALRHVGRRVIMLDPAFRRGEYGTQPPVEGLRLARELGTLFYRSREEFNERFSNAPINPPALGGVTFDVQSYLDYQGRKILDHFDANAYLTLSLAMDLHDVSRGHDGAAAAYARVKAEVLIVGVPEDRLIPIDEQLSLYRGLRDAGVRVSWRELSSPIGHDAFLVETETLGPVIGEFLGSPA